MDTKAVIDHIVRWLDGYAAKSGVHGFVIGISGGIDSAVTSTLCARTGRGVMLLEMPIYQSASQVERAQEHITWLKKKHDQVQAQRVELTATFDAFMQAVPQGATNELRELALANTRARLRMTTLYYIAGLHKLVVAGTGNKVEDFGIGFYTKYGDGGVDLSPIADLTKTQVYEVARELGIIDSILQAKPTDGLWGDDRSDEDQIGAAYSELEWAMAFAENLPREDGKIILGATAVEPLSERQKKVLSIYISRHNANRHKMEQIPVCDIPKELMG